MSQLTPSEQAAINALRSLTSDNTAYHMVQRYGYGTTEQQRRLVRTFISEGSHAPNSMRKLLGGKVYEAVMKCREVEQQREAA